MAIMLVSSSIQFPKSRQQGTMEIPQVFTTHPSKVNPFKTIQAMSPETRYIAPHKVPLQAHIPTEQDWMKQLDIY